jgi:EAL domain-containing protein (putative c-di-GMP-specific phosphodiesterase class I)
MTALRMAEGGGSYGLPSVQRSLLDDVLEPGQLRALFQPIYRLTETGERELFGVEALIRGPVGTNLEMPEVLFDYARRKHRIAELDRACVRAALQTCRGLPALRFFINVHASTLGRDDSFVAFLSQEMAAAGIPPFAIALEIGEHDAPYDRAAFRQTLSAIRALGVRIAVDDFGSGHANARLLLDARPEVVKLTRDVVEGADRDELRRRLLADLARTAEGFSARVIAEGVETAEELAAVRAAGIDVVQGYFLSRPVTAEQLREQLRSK